MSKGESNAAEEHPDEIVDHVDTKVASSSNEIEEISERSISKERSRSSAANSGGSWSERDFLSAKNLEKKFLEAWIISRAATAAKKTNSVWKQATRVKIRVSQSKLRRRVLSSKVRRPNLLTRLSNLTPLQQQQIESLLQDREQQSDQYEDRLRWELASLKVIPNLVRSDAVEALHVIFKYIPPRTPWFSRISILGRRNVLLEEEVSTPRLRYRAIGAARRAARRAAHHEQDLKSDAEVDEGDDFPGAGCIAAAVSLGSRRESFSTTAAQFEGGEAAVVPDIREFTYQSFADSDSERLVEMGVPQTESHDDLGTSASDTVTRVKRKRIPDSFARTAPKPSYRSRTRLSHASAYPDVSIPTHSETEDDLCEECLQLMKEQGKWFKRNTECVKCKEKKSRSKADSLKDILALDSILSETLRLRSKDPSDRFRNFAFGRKAKSSAPRAMTNLTGSKAQTEDAILWSSGPQDWASPDSWPSRDVEARGRVFSWASSFLYDDDIDVDVDVDVGDVPEPSWSAPQAIHNMSYAERSTTDSIDLEPGEQRSVGRPSKRVLESASSAKEKSTKDRVWNGYQPTQDIADILSQYTTLFSRPRNPSESSPTQIRDRIEPEDGQENASGSRDSRGTDMQSFEGKSASG